MVEGGKGSGGWVDGERERRTDEDDRYIPEGVVRGRPGECA